MSNLTARLGSRKMPHKDVPICLDMDLLDDRETALKAFDAAAETARRRDEQQDRMVTRADPKVEAARQHVADLDAQIRDASIILRVKGVDRETYNQWMLACPPRKGKTELFNTSKFYMHAAKASSVYVDEQGAEHPIDDDEWAHIDKILTDGEHDRVAQAVLHVNRSVGAVDVSFFANGSEMTRDSFGISASRGASGSRRGVSGAGSPKKSTSKK